MKRILTVVLMAAGAVSLNAQTNAPATPEAAPTLALSTNAPAADKAYGSYELTLGGGGFTSPKTGDTQFGLNTTLSTDPFKQAPNVWVGAGQSLSWEPSFAGETDLFSEYSWHIRGQLWLDTGWFGGIAYASDSAAVWHTGPYVEAEYYIGDSSFLFFEYDLDMASRGDSTLPYRFGIGITW
jgi:hypothetical protein